VGASSLVQLLEPANSYLLLLSEGCLLDWVVKVHSQLVVGDPQSTHHLLLTKFLLVVKSSALLSNPEFIPVP